MSPKSDRSTTAGAAYLDLRKLAAATNRPTDELHQLYALEGFLDRLTRSTHRDKFVLKGGVLLAAYAERRPTRDVDLAAHQLQADGETIHTLVKEILAVAIDDGLTFDLDKTAVETIRDDADYPGLRVKVSGSLATAMIRFHIDINIGDPIWPEPSNRVATTARLDPTDPRWLLGRARARREDRHRPPTRDRQHEMARLRRHRLTLPHRHQHPDSRRVDPARR